MIGKWQKEGQGGQDKEGQGGKDMEGQGGQDKEAQGGQDKEGPGRADTGKTGQKGGGGTACEWSWGDGGSRNKCLLIVHDLNLKYLGLIDYNLIGWAVAVDWLRLVSLAGGGWGGGGIGWKETA